MKLIPYVKRYFDADKGGAPGSAAPAAPATPDAPAAPAAPAEPANPAATELADFTAPDFDDGSGPAPIPGQKQPEPKKDEPKKVEPPKPGAKVEPVKEPPAAQLRTELANVKKERDEWKAKAEGPNPKIQTLEKSISDLTSERDTLATELQSLRNELSLHDPLSSEAIKKLDSDYDAKFNSATRFMPELTDQISPLVQEYAALSAGPADKRADAMRAFRQKVGDLVGPENAATALGIVADGLEFLNQRNAAIKNVRENGSKLHFDGLKASYDKNAALTDSHLKDALNVSEDIMNAQPFHPMSFAKRAEGQLDDAKKESIKYRLSNVDDYMRFAANGLSPDAQAALNNLPPAEKKARKEKLDSQRLEAARWVRENAKQSFYMKEILPAFLEDYSRLLEEAKKRGEGAPPDPNAGGGGTRKEGGDDDLSGYKNPSLEGL